MKSNPFCALLSAFFITLLAACNGSTAVQTTVNQNLPAVYAGSVNWVDANGDNWPDLFMCGRDSLGQPFAGLFQQIRVTAPGLTAISFQHQSNAGFLPLLDASSDWADVNGDGKPDLLLCGCQTLKRCTTLIYLNQGNGQFTALDPGITGLHDGQVRWGDLEGDGDLDILVSGYSPEFFHYTEVFVNDGNLHFTPAKTALEGFAAPRLSWADMDGDGDLDLAIAGFNRGDTLKMQVWEFANGAYRMMDGFGQTAPWYGTLRWVNLDQDKHLELFTSGFQNGKSMHITYDWNGTGWTHLSTNIPPAFHLDADFADLDQDNDQDILLSGNTGGSFKTLVLKNNGQGNFISTGQALDGYSDPLLKWADVDGDGDFDFIIMGGNPQNPLHTRIFLNKNNQFSN
ncbi:MAG: VCBS repeat-containing protein [Bacteroidia bacterium]|nr:VCBS repeat-containing protein [Bacteroidia bacterium]